MSNSSFKRYRVYLVVGRYGSEVEITVSVWDEEYIEGVIEELYGDRAYISYYEEIESEENN